MDRIWHTLTSLAAIVVSGCTTDARITDFTNKMERVADCMDNVSRYQLSRVDESRLLPRGNPEGYKREYVCTNSGARAEYYVRRQQCLHQNEDPVILSQMGSPIKVKLGATLDNTDTLLLFTPSPDFGFGVSIETTAELTFDQVPLSALPGYIYDKKISEIGKIDPTIQVACDEPSGQCSLQKLLYDEAYSSRAKLTKIVQVLVTSSPTTTGACEDYKTNPIDCRPGCCKLAGGCNGRGTYDVAKSRRDDTWPLRDF